MTTNQLAYWRDQETKRSNVAKEHLENLKRSNELYGLIETERHNRAMERFKKDEETRANYQLIANAIGNVISGIRGGQMHTLELAKGITSLSNSGTSKMKK